MTIEQLITALQNRTSKIFQYDETDIYEIFEPHNDHFCYSIEKEFLHAIPLTSFKGMELIEGMVDFFFTFEP